MTDVKYVDLGSVKLPAGRLDRVRWQGQATYRVLSYSFSVRWNRKAVGEYVRYVLGDFEVDGDGRGDLGGAYSILGPGAGDRFHRLLLGDFSLINSPDPAPVLEQLLWHVYSTMLEKCTEFLLIHAGSLVTLRGDGLLLPADSGSGKTTLVTALVQAGFGYLSDEVAAIDPATGTVHAYPRALNLKVGSLGLFPHIAARLPSTRFEKAHRFVRPRLVRAGSVVSSSSVRVVISPRYQAGSPTTVTPLNRAAATVLLWRNCMNVSAHGSRALHLLADVAQRARAYQLVSGDLEEAVRAVLRVGGVERLA